jgi:hypothetical protein
MIALLAAALVRRSPHQPATTDTIGYVATDTWDNTASSRGFGILALHRAMLAQNTAGKPLGDAGLNDQAKGQRRDGVGDNRLGIRRPCIEPSFVPSESGPRKATRIVEAVVLSGILADPRSPKRLRRRCCCTSWTGTRCWRSISQMASSVRRQKCFMPCRNRRPPLCSANEPQRPPGTPNHLGMRYRSSIRRSIPT